MIDPVFTLTSLIKFLILFFLLFYLIPSKAIGFDKEKTAFLDRFFISLVHSNMAVILIVHILVLLNIYEPLTMIFACFFTFIAVMGKLKGSRKYLVSVGMRLTVYMLEMSDNIQRLKNKITELFKNIYRISVKGLQKGYCYFLADPFFNGTNISVFLLAAFIRFRHSLTHLYFGASDSYVHLAWSKYLGVNMIYKDGIYPSGFHAIISSFNRLFFMDAYTVVRFIGPVGGLIIVLSIYYVLTRSFKSKYIALLAVFLYTAYHDLPSIVWRQIAALPQEYSAMFFLPGLYFFYEYFRRNNKSYLFLAGECLCLTILIHPYSTVFLFIGYIVISVLNIHKILKTDTFIYSVATMSCAGLLGVIPLITAYITGMKFHGSLQYVMRSAELPESSANPALILEETPSMLIFLLCIALLLFAVLISFITNKKTVYSENSKMFFTFILFSVIMYLLFRAPYFGIPELMDLNRIGIFFSLIAAAVYGITLKIFDIITRKNKIADIMKATVCILTAVAVLGFTQLYIPRGERYEYDQAVNAYLKIKRNFSPLNWTIISPVEQYQQCLYYGWHYELLDLVRSMSDPEIEKIEIPTEYVFIFAEKIPLYSEEEVTLEDAGKDIPVISDNPYEHYVKAHVRRIIEAKTLFWAENLKKNNKNVTVFYEDEHLRVYQLKQDAENPVNLLKYQVGGNTF